MSVGVGLIGYGFAGRYLHAPVICSTGMELRAVVTSRHDCVKADKIPTAVLPDLGSALARPDIDLIVLATPNNLHFPQALAALKAGKHVVVDKPFSTTVIQAQELIEEAAQRGLKLSAYHNRRWDSDFLTVQKIVASRVLGQVFSFEFRWDRFRPEIRNRWKERAADGGGLLSDLAPHLIDQTLQLFGWPDWVQADVFTQRTGGFGDDGFEILMAKGALRIRLAANSMVVDGGHRYRIHGDKASFLKSGLDVQEVHIRDGRNPLDKGFGVEPDTSWGELIGADGVRTRIRSEVGSWRTFYSMLQASIECGDPLPVTPQEARDVIAILEMARESARNAKRVYLHP